ncbi:biotin--[acetyl-CoA-carboxylase] ligase [Actinomadura sp. HBU206391]|uniref:biotin--[acetyl-CoA-carboxylase] ligase n=1 Tax=Actinomadura sp. HBU206391 TaxID=2731692 RepID=UPI002905892C|nr:biotin--[acetyl-CoA-carboxylase] ligase [Actinomadura sp. HBU206391]
MSTSPYGDLTRPPLSEKALRRVLVRPESLWHDVRVVPETGSTNADLARAAMEGAAEGTVMIAEAQTAGRGRLGRQWAAPPRSALTFSVLLRPSVPITHQGWVPLLTGVAVAAAVRRMTARAKAGDFGEATGEQSVDARLKWPNDVMVGERKLAGILAERADHGIVVGVGLNVSLRADELPVRTATSLTLENAAFSDREPLLRAILRELETWYTAWQAVGGDADADGPGGYPDVTGLPAGRLGGLRGTYRSLCATLGRDVHVDLPADEAVDGTADDIDAMGRLLVRTAEGEHALSAGDVVHVRPGT